MLTNGGLDGKLFNVITPLLMFVPALLVVGYVLITKQGLKITNWKFGYPKYLLYGALIPAILSLILMITIETLGFGKSAHFVLENGQINVLKGQFIMGNGTQSYIHFAFNMIFTAIAFSILSGVFALGEELGWRGFLQEKFINNWGMFKGIIALGLIWGFWHFPYIISGYNYPEAPILGAFILFPMLTVFASFFLAWLTIKAKSIWPAVLAHGSVNAFYGSFVQGMSFGDNRLMADLIVIFVWLLIGLISFVALRKHFSLNPYHN